MADGDKKLDDEMSRVLNLMNEIANYDLANPVKTSQIPHAPVASAEPVSPPSTAHETNSAPLPPRFPSPSSPTRVAAAEAPPLTKDERYAKFLAAVQQFITDPFYSSNTLTWRVGENGPFESKPSHPDAQDALLSSIQGYLDAGVSETALKAAKDMKIPYPTNSVVVSPLHSAPTLNSLEGKQRFPQLYNMLNGMRYTSTSPVAAIAEPAVTRVEAAQPPQPAASQPAAQAASTTQANPAPVATHLGYYDMIFMQSWLIATGDMDECRYDKKNGHKISNQDGSPGPVTTAAIKHFQQRHGLPETGVLESADKRTLRDEAQAIFESERYKVQHDGQLPIPQTPAGAPGAPAVKGK